MPHERLGTSLKRLAFLENYKLQLPADKYQTLCNSGPYFSVEQRLLLQTVGMPQTDIDRLFPAVSTGGQKVEVSEESESGGHPFANQTASHS